MTRNINVHILHTGSVIVDSALPFNHKKIYHFLGVVLFKHEVSTFVYPFLFT